MELGLPMTLVDRFGVSMDTELLAAFDALIAARGYANRSEAIRDMVRDALSQDRIADASTAVSATLTFLFEHARESSRRLRLILREQPNLLAGVQVFPLDGDREVQIAVLRGGAGEVQRLADRIQGLRGVSHGHLAMIAVEPQQGSVDSR